MAEIDMTAPTVAPVEGKYGVLRNGSCVGPMLHAECPGGVIARSHSYGHVSWPFGGSFRYSQIPHALDLIAIISAPNSVEPDATQETGVVERATRFTITAEGATVNVDVDSEGIFGIEHADESGDAFMACSAPLAVAIARAILRMAGESK
jgi:hypothetical protein